VTTTHTIISPQVQESVLFLYEFIQCTSRSFWDLSLIGLRITHYPNNNNFLWRIRKKNWSIIIFTYPFLLQLLSAARKELSKLSSIRWAEQRWRFHKLQKRMNQSIQKGNNLNRLSSRSSGSSLEDLRIWPFWKRWMGKKESKSVNLKKEKPTDYPSWRNSLIPIFKANLLLIFLRISSFHLDQIRNPSFECCNVFAWFA